MSRYSIGIDLGTSNSALAFVGEATSELLSVSQRESISSTTSASTLPSVLYLAPQSDQATLGADSVVGAFARFQSTRQPGRVVASAKSWLCHDGVDREERFLPWGSDE